MLKFQVQEPFIMQVDVIETSKDNCDFCSGNVADNPFNDPSNNDKTTLFSVADSAFKHQDYNALFIAKKHNPLSLTFEDYSALFKTANKWFQAVIKGNDDFIIL